MAKVNGQKYRLVSTPIKQALYDTVVHTSVFFPAKIEGVGERHILGGASVHIKAFGSTPIPLQRQISTEGIGGLYPLSMLGRTLHINRIWS